MSDLVKRLRDEHLPLSRGEVADEVEKLEAKLAKAVEIALEECPFRWGTGSWMDWRSERRATLAKLQGDT